VRTVTITGVTGSPKKISGSNAGWHDSLADLYNSPSATSVTTPYSLPSHERLLLLFGTEGSFTMQFSADSSGVDGQGLKLPHGTYVKVTAVSGTVCFVSGKYLKRSDSASSAYGNPNKITVNVNDRIGDGFLVCNKNGSFTTEFVASALQIFDIIDNEELITVIEPVNETPM